ncbi:MAG: DUF2946 family protein [Bacteroidota bacterium]
MKNRTNNFVSVIVLILYGTLTSVTVPFHFHEDSPFATGSGVHTIVQHDDASHCHHHSIDSHDDCTLCSFVSHSGLCKASSVVPLIDPVSQEYISHFSFTAVIDFHSTHSRRGPPALFS